MSPIAYPRIPILPDIPQRRADTQRATLRR